MALARPRPLAARRLLILAVVVAVEIAALQVAPRAVQVALAVVERAAAQALRQVLALLARLTQAAAAVVVVSQVAHLHSL